MVMVFLEVNYQVWSDVKNLEPRGECHETLSISCQYYLVLILTQRYSIFHAFPRI